MDWYKVFFKHGRDPQFAKASSEASVKKLYEEEVSDLTMFKDLSLSELVEKIEINKTNLTDEEVDELLRKPHSPDVAVYGTGDVLVKKTIKEGKDEFREVPRTED